MYITVVLADGCVNEPTSSNSCNSCEQCSNSYSFYWVVRMTIFEKCRCWDICSNASFVSAKLKILSSTTGLMFSFSMKWFILWNWVLVPNKSPRVVHRWTRPSMIFGTSPSGAWPRSPVNAIIPSGRTACRDWRRVDNPPTSMTVYTPFPSRVRPLAISPHLGEVL